MLKKTKSGLNRLGNCLISFWLIFAVLTIHADELTKLQRWDQLAEEVNLWVDGVGGTIDKGIKDTVIVLNLLGLTTRQSCEGHFDWGCPYPWVDFVINQPEAEILAMQFDQIFINDFFESLMELRSKYPGFTDEEIYKTPEGQQLLPLYNQLGILTSQYDDIARVEMKPLLDLIDQFYENRDVEAHQKLVIEFSGIGLTRLESQGWDEQEKRVGSEREKYLKLYQQEMQAFTEFLTEIYFSQ